MLPNKRRGYNVRAVNSMTMISKRIEQIAESQTLAVNTLCQELIAEGKGVLNFSVGEPDIAPPASLMGALVTSLEEGFTKYTNPVGLTEAREKIAEYFSKQNNISFSAKEIALTSGGKQALYALFQSIINPGDEVIVFKPYWVSYTEQIKLAGGKPVFVDLDENHDLDITAFNDALTDKTKAVILNSPSNPTSAVLSPEKIKQLANVLEGKDIAIISDDVYQSLVYEGDFYHIAQHSEQIRKQTIIIQSFSKSLSMTGLRLGVVIAHEDIISAIAKFQGHASGNPTSLIQMAVAKIINNEEQYQKEYRELFDSRRKLVSELLKSNPHISFNEPMGAFYFFINISKLEKDSKIFAEKLLSEKHVAFVPGAAFGAEGFVRMSFAASEENLRKGVELFNSFCEEYNS